MGFVDDFNGCLSSSGLPTPGEIADSAEDVLDLMEKLHHAWEAAGGEEETTLAAIAALGAATGIDEGVLAAFAAAGEVTVTAYLLACASCAAIAAGSAIWDLLASTDDDFVKQQVASAANDNGIPQPAATA